MINKKIELLSPAGDFERLRSAIQFGANAVYLAGKSFGMRTASGNFSDEELKEAVIYAHERNVKVYVTVNIVAHNKEIEELPSFLNVCEDANVDAYIVSDLGVFSLIRRLYPQAELHISTQAGVCNYETANMLYNMGAKRIVLAREVPMEEIAQIRANIPDDMDIEAFCHGAMCVSFSGRCLISSYLTGRDPNRGDCAQPCRWKYSLMEEKRPGQYFPVEEDSQGTFLYNSRDMCMIDYIPEMVKAGITSFKIEGRAKSAYYVSLTTNAYRRALDDFMSEGENYTLKPWIKEELNKISHREYSTGFYMGGEPGQVVENGGYVREYDVVGVVSGCENGIMTISQRNRFFVGDTLDILEPDGSKPTLMVVEKMYNDKDEEIEVAPHSMMTVKIKTDVVLKEGSLLRKNKPEMAGIKS